MHPLFWDPELSRMHLHPQIQIPNAFPETKPLPQVPCLVGTSGKVHVPASTQPPPKFWFLHSSSGSISFKAQYIAWIRVANVVAHHYELLTQWRYIWMSKLGAKIFLILTTYGLQQFAKSAFLKLTVLFFQYFCCQNWDQLHKLSGKNTHIIFFYFWFKNKRVWAEKIGKKQKNFKNLKVAGNYPSI